MLRLARFAGRIAYSNLRELSSPYRLTYAVTSRCQARCGMCDIWRKPYTAELTLKEIDSFFRQAQHFSWINLTGGELFQRPDILEIFLTVISNSEDLYLLNFPTNGFQTEEIVAAVDTILKKTTLPRLIVSISLDGPKELHEHIRNLPGAWDRAVQTFAELRKRRSRRFSVFFGYTMQTANLDAFDATLNAGRTVLQGLSANDFHVNLAHVSGHYYGNDTFNGTPDPIAATRRIDQIHADRKTRCFDPVAFIEHRYQQLAPIYLKERKHPLTCQAAAASCFIDPDGTVYACSGFGAELGRLRENDMNFTRIWQATTRRQTRELIRQGCCPGCWTPCEAYQSILAHLLPREKGRR